MNRQTRIFSQKKDYWYENVLGSIIKPITEKYKNDLEWFWFTQYDGFSDRGECDETKVKTFYAGDLEDNYRSIKFRYSIQEHKQQEFEDELAEACRNKNCCAAGFIIWDKVGDVGSNRHIGGAAAKSAARQQNRADIITGLYHHMALLTLDTLEGPDLNRDYHPEYNSESKKQINNSSLTQPHHIFCNMTNVPLVGNVKVWVDSKQVSVHLQTYWRGYYSFKPGFRGESTTADFNEDMPILF